MLSDRLAPFHGLRGSLASAYAGRCALFPVGAILATLALVASGLDGWARDAILRAIPPEDHRELLWRSFVAGAIAPVVLGLWLAVRGGIQRHRPDAAAGCALLQTIVIVGALTAALKLATGRPVPRLLLPASHFEPFAIPFPRAMWPSGHTTEAVGAASALATVYGSRAAWVAGSAFAVAVAASMLLGSFHFLSDVVAGVLLAWPVGRTVGRAFREWADRAPE